jgi:hypothetical protein
MSLAVGFAGGVVLMSQMFAVKIQPVTETLVSTSTVTVLGEQTRCQNAGGLLSISQNGDQPDGTYQQEYLDINCTTPPHQLFDEHVSTPEAW